MNDLLDTRLRPWTEETASDLTMSYSKLSVYENCPHRYDLYYNQKKLGLEESTIALQIGSLCHKALEIKADAVMSGTPVNYDLLTDVVFNGTSGSNVDETDKIIGIHDLKKKYGVLTWFERDDEDHNYEDKTKLFLNNVLHHEVADNQGDLSKWHTFKAEERFDFVYQIETESGIKNVHFLGFIDRIDTRINEAGETEYRVVDYKTSKKVYDSKKTATALQMVIYGFYIYLQYGVLPTEYQYSFVLLDKTQLANTVGYLKRAIKKIDRLLVEIFSRQESGSWDEKAGALCYWCQYRPDSIVADPIVGDLCEKYCLWTPDNKTFEKADDDRCSKKPSIGSRKLFF